MHRLSSIATVCKGSIVLRSQNSSSGTRNSGGIQCGWWTAGGSVVLASSADVASVLAYATGASGAEPDAFSVAIV